VIRGTLAAAVTPLRADSFDGEAADAVMELYAAAGLDGILALGTTGEGVLFAPEERRAIAERFVAARGPLKVIVHCGAQSTRETVALAAHAAEAGADGVAVIGPPYFPLDERSLLAHFSAAAQACAPAPFYLYEFAARSGYAVPLSVVAQLREAAPNFQGLKVSDARWDDFAGYLVEGLDVFVGPESLIARGLEAGAVGAVSGLAAGFPELVADLVHEPSTEAAARVAAVRDAVQRFPFQSALKHVLHRRGLPIESGVRAPLRGLDIAECAELDRELDDAAGVLGAAFAREEAAA